MRIKNIFWGFILLTIILTNCEQKKAAITTSSREALKLYMQGVSLAEKFYDEEAIVKFQEAIKLDSTFVMAHYYLSRSYESLGNLEKARASIEKAKKFSGLSTPLEWNYVNAWDKILDQNYVAVVNILKNVLQEYSNDRHALFVIGKTYFLMKHYEEAINVIKMLVKLEPMYAPGFNQLGYIYKEMGNIEWILLILTILSILIRRLLFRNKLDAGQYHISLMLLYLIFV